MFVKFIFIFFFRTGFEPGFMFDLTPYYLLTGVNNLHLLFLSLIIITFNVYFHINVNKRNLLFSFLPTGIMLAGLGIRIASGEMVISNFLHYLVFGCLLIITLIDNKHILMLPDTIVAPKKEPEGTKPVTGKPAIAGAEPQATQVLDVGKPVRIEGIDEILALHKQTLIDLRAMLNDDLQRAQKIMGELESKSRKIDHLAEEIEERRKNLVEEERLFRRRYISSLSENIYVKPIKSDEGLPFDVRTRDEIRKPPTMLDDYMGCAAIVKRGILKQVNRPFVELLGYDTKTILDKCLLDFVAPEGLPGVEGYYLNRLKSEVVTTYETVLVTSDNKKIRVKITMKPTIYDGEKADMILVRNL